MDDGTKKVLQVPGYPHLNLPDHPCHPVGCRRQRPRTPAAAPLEESKRRVGGGGVGEEEEGVEEVVGGDHQRRPVIPEAKKGG